MSKPSGRRSVKCIASQAQDVPPPPAGCGGSLLAKRPRLAASAFARAHWAGQGARIQRLTMPRRALGRDGRRLAIAARTVGIGPGRRPVGAPSMPSTRFSFAPTTMPLRSVGVAAAARRARHIRADAAAAFPGCRTTPSSLPGRRDPPGSRAARDRERRCSSIRASAPTRSCRARVVASRAWMSEDSRMTDSRRRSSSSSAGGAASSAR